MTVDRKKVKKDGNAAKRKCVNVCNYNSLEILMFVISAMFSFCQQSAANGQLIHGWF